MPIDPTIAMSYRPISLDVAGAYQAAQERKALEARNALAATQQAAAQDEMRNALAARQYAAGADLNNPQNAMRLFGYGKEGADMYQSLQAGRASSAAARKSALEAAGVKAGQYRQMLSFVNNPNDAAVWLQMHHDDPDMADSPVARMPLDVALSRIPQDAAGFQKWKEQAALGIDKYITRNTMTAQQQAELELKQQNAASLQNYRNQQLGLSRQRVGLQRQRLSAAQGETGLPKEERAAMAKFNVDVMYRGVRDAATRSRKTLPAIDTALSILDKGFDTGFGTEAKTQAARVLSALGISEAGKYAADAAVFQSTVAQTVLDRQLEQKGPQTEADAARITQTSAQLKTPKEANRFILNVAKVQAKRDIAQQKFYDDYWNKNGTYEGVEDAWYSGEGGKSLFEDPLLSKSTRAPAAGKPAASAGDVDYSNPLLGGRP